KNSRDFRWYISDRLVCAPAKAGPRRVATTHRKKMKTKKGFTAGWLFGQLALLLALLPLTAKAGVESHVVPGSIWKYFDLGTAPANGWSLPAFNDSTWASGPSQLGFGDGDEA